MILFPDLLNLPRQLRHPEVRDLAWVILAPPMLSQTPWPQRHPLAGSDWVQAPDQLEHWLRTLDQHSDPLHDDHQHHDQRRQRGHGRLFLPSGADEDLVEDRHDDADRRDFEDQINIHIR